MLFNGVEIREVRQQHVLHQHAVNTAPLLEHYVQGRMFDAPVACTFRRACLYSNRLWLSDSLRQYNRKIAQCTGDLSVAFWSQTSITQAFEAALNDTVRHHSDAVGALNYGHHLRHMPHFLTNFLKGSAVAAAVAYDPQVQERVRTRCANVRWRKVDAPRGAASARQIAACASAWMPYQNLPNPVVLASDLVMGKHAKHPEWIGGFLAQYLKRAKNANPFMLVEERPVRRKYDPPAIHCFDSVTVSARHHSALDAVYDHPLRSAGVQRTPRQAPACHFSYTIISRSTTDPGIANYTGPRSIPANILHQLEKRIESYSNQLGLIATVSKVLQMGSLSFDEQKEVIQNTDVLIAVHGAELANCVFMRHHAALIEIYPFGYHFPCFREFFQTLNIHHMELFGGPSHSIFEACARYLFPASNLQHSYGDMRALYMQKLAKYRAAHSEDQRMKASKFGFPGWSPEAKVARRCAREQPVSFDPDYVAEKAVRLAVEKVAALQKRPISSCNEKAPSVP